MRTVSYWTDWTRPRTAQGQTRVLSGQTRDDTQQKASGSLKPLPVCPHRQIQLKQLNSGDWSCFNWITNEIAAGCDANRACRHCSFTPREREKTPLCVDAGEQLPFNIHLRQSHQSEQLGFTRPRPRAEIMHDNTGRKNNNYPTKQMKWICIRWSLLLQCRTMLCVLEPSQQIWKDC